MNESVWLVWFEQEQSEGEDIELLIGVYRSEEAAKDAIDRVKNRPGFRDYPKGLGVHEYKLDQDHWIEGFIRD